MIRELLDRAAQRLGIVIDKDHPWLTGVRSGVALGLVLLAMVIGAVL